MKQENSILKCLQYFCQNVIKINHYMLELYCFKLVRFFETQSTAEHRVVTSWVGAMLSTVDLYTHNHMFITVIPACLLAATYNKSTSTCLNYCPNVSALFLTFVTLCGRNHRSVKVYSQTRSDTANVIDMKQLLHLVHSLLLTISTVRLDQTQLTSATWNNSFISSILTATHSVCVWPFDSASSICGKMNGWLQILRSCMMVFISILAPPRPCTQPQLITSHTSALHAATAHQTTHLGPARSHCSSDNSVR